MYQMQLLYVSFHEPPNIYDLKIVVVFINWWLLPSSWQYEHKLLQKTKMTERQNSFCQGRIKISAVPPWFTTVLFEVLHTHVTDAYFRRRILCRKAFDCALRGPFARLFPTRLSAPRALCGGISCFISASTVYIFYNNYGNYITFFIFCQGNF